MGIDLERAARLDLMPSPWDTDTPADETEMVDGFMWWAWTDGSVEPNPGRGGWAAIIIAPDGTQQEFSGAEPQTTSSRAELSGIKIAVEPIPPGAAATIFSDSQYAVRVLSGRYKAKKNRDLISAIQQAAKTRRIKYRWLRGHSGNALNETADRLVRRARRAVC